MIYGTFQRWRTNNENRSQRTTPADLRRFRRSIEDNGDDCSNERFCHFFFIINEMCIMSTAFGSKINNYNKNIW